MTHEICLKKRIVKTKKCQVFFFEALQRKKKEIQKKTTKTCRKRKFFEDIHQQGNWKKSEFF